MSLSRLFAGEQSTPVTIPMSCINRHFGKITQSLVSFLMDIPAISICGALEHSFFDLLCLRKRVSRKLCEFCIQRIKIYYSTISYWGSNLDFLCRYVSRDKWFVADNPFSSDNTATDTKYYDFFEYFLKQAAVQKGKQLYLNYYDHDDHAQLAQYVRENVRHPWIIPYDDSPQIVEMYEGLKTEKILINYSAAQKTNSRDYCFC